MMQNMAERWHLLPVQRSHLLIPRLISKRKHDQNFVHYCCAGPYRLRNRLQHLPENGKQGLSIDCSGEAMSPGKLLRKRDASCAGTGYEIVGTDGTPQPAESDKTLGVDVGNYKSRSVLVVCK